MIRSMTGFGRASAEIEGLSLTVEVRTVNHRHLDVSVRLPRALSAFEPQAKKAAQVGFLRGKIDASVQFSGEVRGRTTVEIDREVAAVYIEAASTLAPTSPVPTAAELLALPGVAKVVESGFDETTVEAPLLAAIVEASERAFAMREAEGRAIQEDLGARLDTVTALTGAVEEQSDEVLSQGKLRLRRRLEQLREETGLLDEARLHQEVVLAADRMDVTEEIVRLRSHVEQFAATLSAADAGEPVGRRLDFLVQEMGRESNTIGSKAGDASVAHRAVDLKTELERIREQVQNVE